VPMVGRNNCPHNRDKETKGQAISRRHHEKSRWSDRTNNQRGGGGACWGGLN